MKPIYHESVCLRALAAFLVMTVILECGISICGHIPGYFTPVRNQRGPA